MRRCPKLNLALYPNLAAMVKPKRNKYGARGVEVDGQKFDSQAEHRYYCGLLLRERAGEVSDIKLHTRYPIFLNGIKICDVEDDFSFDEAGKRVAVDVKGKLTRESRIKHKLVMASYPDLDWRIVKV